ncbi:M15 family metallopeptidase [Herbaspirillum seropedicae]|uniref:Peptidase M15B and M15C, D,D-carboxypeptidase VanY/endolysins protein n=1 Tax=Herbaspirillum seropedicae (strain SmR1) TaxID=757424 RepID=D8IST1_HERSS|nr:M15 family metallopeptidase [Herbaspirillum seropedicae]ADJ65497.1 peptidase M15B and M15C, D,D-carboxypeptidase VanY/endolysins protein [Herbaspirillum seropedicae SmR1]AKN67327.1 peptidase M15B and M15C, D,D-carboxypeptidase VanY/endolysin [Herbaspirillum seropedicae]NQE31920.1 peptidase M15B and M15C, D,D-carboxypeptidase VanY/endolysin [Herbaspirillum seropedicae]UMU24358.1 M15 family metallopeptidase [Herbaspirillum seropedicae]
MVFLLIATYLLVSGLAMWLLLFPSGRAQTLRFLQTRCSRLRNRWERYNDRGDQMIAEVTSNIRSSLTSRLNYVRKNYLVLSIIVALLIGPAIVALLLAGKSMLQGFDDTQRATNSQIAELLKGEQLVAPPPLPPDMFTTAEVVQVRPMLVDASRNWQLLNPEYAQRLLLVFKIMKEKHGYEMALIEGYRSPQRQNMLAGMGGGITNAAAFQSYHQYGLAGDCAFVRNGKLVISEKDPWAMAGYRLYGEVAESVGLTWGGRWKLMDFGHTEYRMPGVMKK